MAEYIFYTNPMSRGQIAAGRCTRREPTTSRC